MTHAVRPPTPRRSRLSGLLREWGPLVLLVLGVLAARSSLADHYHVPSGSMAYALLPGDHVVVDKAAFGLRLPFTRQVLLEGETPRRGDVVIFDSPDTGVRLIKRVVALGGERVAVRDGRVFIDGRPLARGPEPGLERHGDRRVRLNLEHGGGPNLGPQVVPEGHVLVLGDHRGNSRDGRMFGFVPVAALYGRARGVFWRAGDGPTWRSL